MPCPALKQLHRDQLRAGSGRRDRQEGIHLRPVGRCREPRVQDGVPRPAEEDSGHGEHMRFAEG